MLMPTSIIEQGLNNTVPIIPSLRTALTDGSRSSLATAPAAGPVPHADWPV